MHSQELQSLFINHFKRKEHTLVPSSSVIPYSDSTLLFVNSGMVQFKPFFLSQTDLPYVRAVSAQNCIRAGGKHNDLDDVGKDSYHHTFFIMLGNWSFGDYFKKEAIDYAWDFLVNVLKLDKNRIYVSYYASENGCEPNYIDKETRDLWLRYLDSEKVLPFGPKDNFWEMGDIGPCGPCTEIHYDSREDPRDGASFVNKDHPDVIEIWNIVFIEYFRNCDQSLSELKTKCIDTGMGMERVLRIVNGYKSNYMTDPFRILINSIEKEIINKDALLKGVDELNIGNHNALENNKTNKEEHCITNNHNDNSIGITTKSIEIINEDADESDFLIYKDTFCPEDKDFYKDMAMRVIADHSRTIAICLFDGVRFSSVGRGYVLRRIMRRAIRYCNELGLSNNMHKFIKIAGKNIGINISEDLLEFANSEECLFLKTLEKGKALLNKKTGHELSGMDAFTLYSTYGFPIDLTEIICEERKIKVNREEFEAIMLEMKEKSRRKKEEDEIIDYRVLNKLIIYEKTNDEKKYTHNNIESNVLCILKGNDIVYELKNKKSLRSADQNNITFEQGVVYALVSEETCFYSESGGQVGDRGIIRFIGDYSCEVNVYDTMKMDGYVFHLFRGNGLILRKSNVLSCVLSFDEEIRGNIMMNHTGTHLLNHTLRKYFTNIEQKGSLVDDQKLRFDFSYNKGFKPEEIKNLEDYMNIIINEEIPVEIAYKNIADVIKSDDVIYLKEEKYPDTVRVVSLVGISSELCGGTHLKNTKDIKRIRIYSEGSISNNIRRIIAVTGHEALKLEENLKNSNPLDSPIPLYERLLLIKDKEGDEKHKQILWKESMNANMNRIKSEIDSFKTTGRLNHNNRFKMDKFGFIFECDLKDERNISKDLNAIAMILDKQNVAGFVYAVINGNLIYAFRGEGALSRGEKFVEIVGNGTIKGKDTCCNGKAILY